MRGGTSQHRSKSLCSFSGHGCTLYFLRAIVVQRRRIGFFCAHGLCNAEAIQRIPNTVIKGPALPGRLYMVIMNSNLGVVVESRSWGRSPLSVSLLILAVILLISGCRKQEAAAPVRLATPVVVAKVEKRKMPVEVTAIGTVAAYSVSVRAQVSGQLMEVHFLEGDFVRKGQLLFTIDSRPYEADLARAEAQLARDKATAENDHVQAQRYKHLFDEGIGTREQADTFESSANAADATIRADEAEVQTAKLNLEYCEIYSPLDGRTGNVMIKAGNLVKVSDVPMVVINRVAPIGVDFTIPQQYLPDVKKHMEEGPLRVTATLPNDSGPVEQGTLFFVDNFVDVTTGTIHLKARFANDQNRLWPGLFVNTVLTLSQQAGAIVVPAQAISSGQKGPFVYVVKADNTVEARPVVSSRTVRNEAVIDKGLEPGETIVTDGQVRLVPGAKVEIKEAVNNAETPGQVPDPPADTSQGAANRAQERQGNKP
jgi:multidrug efflux system membrane fusion protein